jgi:Bacteriophage probable baseplate hub protein
MAQGTTNVPKPSWQLLYKGANITGQIAPHITEIKWCERIGGQAADMSVTVEDVHRFWQQTAPVLTDEMALSIGYAGAALLDCGTFTIDEFELTGPPDILTLRCTESWTSAPIRTPNSQAYENMTLSQIAQAVAARHGWTAITSAVQPDTAFARVTQTIYDGSDLGFLKRIANQHNYEFNVRPPQLIFYSRTALEAQAPAGPTITRQMVRKFKLGLQSAGERTYSGAQISYLDAATKSVLGAQAKTTGAAPTSDTLNYTERVENNQQAALKVGSVLHEHNMLQYVGELEMPGTIQYRAGQTVAVADWGAFANTWIIEEAEHTFKAKRGGYITKLSLRTLGAGEQVGIGESG